LWQAAQSTAAWAPVSGKRCYDPDLLDGNAPAANGVALLAIRAQLALVDIRVAVLALAADIIEYHLHVASRAGHANVHSAQRYRVWL